MATQTEDYPIHKMDDLVNYANEHGIEFTPAKAAPPPPVTPNEATPIPVTATPEATPTPPSQEDNVRFFSAKDRQTLNKMIADAKQAKEANN